MTMTDFILTCLTVITICIPIYFRKYLSEKAKNLATTQDIDKITTIVETIKTEHAKKLEEIKQNNQLALATKNKHQDLKIKIYCDAIEAITRVGNTFVMFAKLDYTSDDFAKEMLDVGIKISKVQVVGDTPTVDSVIKIMAGFTKASLHLQRIRMDILDKSDLLKLLENDITNCSSPQELERLNAELDRLKKEFYDEYVSYSKICVEKQREINVFLPEFVTSIRDELELSQLDFTMFENYMDDMTSTYDEFASEISKSN